MTSNQAFAKKLQAAIRAKIQELGVDADEDMAEYSMILAANKKDKNQIKKELHLFLGKNTGCFVDWLFAAFERIQKTLAEHKYQERSNKPRPAAKETKKSTGETTSDEPTASTKSNKSVIRSGQSTRDDNLPRSEKHERKSESSKDRPSRSEPLKESKTEELPSSRRTSLRHASYKNEPKEENKKRKRHKDRASQERSSRRSGSRDKKPSSTRQYRSERPSKRHAKKPRIASSSPHTSSRKRSSPEHNSQILDHNKPAEHSPYFKPHKQDSEESRNEESSNSTPVPLTSAWDGRITIDDDSSDDDDAEAQIDALLKGLDDLIDTIPDTSILSGSNLASHLIQQKVSIMSSQTVSETSTVTNVTNSVDMHQRKVVEKCRFWPGCDKNAQCLYHHPTDVCTIFPNCPYGDRCLNIHPLCKFNKKCRKLRCPFTHDLKGVATVVLYPHEVAAAQQMNASTSGSINSPSSLIQPTNTNTNPQSVDKHGISKRPEWLSGCRFKGRCAVPDCKFSHPPPCRFGLRCQNPTCNFSHRKPNFKQFQWVNNNQT